MSASRIDLDEKASMLEDMLRWSIENPRVARKVAADYRRLRVRLAQDDVNEFIEFVLRDETTGKSVTQEPMHEEFQALADRHERLILWGMVESGKCLAPKTRVLMHDGSSRRADAVQVGDLLAGPSGRRRVLSTCVGRDEMFKIVPTSHRAPFVCNGSHVLTLVHTDTNEVIDIPLNEYLRRTARWKSSWKLFSPRLTRFAKVAPPEVDPYFLGVWCGDGSKSLKSVSISKPDAEIYQLCLDQAKVWGLRVRVSVRGVGCPTYHLAGPYSGKRNPLLDAVRREAGLCVRLPRSCRVGSVAVRRAFLAGMLDTGGHLQAPGYYEIVQKRKGYARDICFIARSLGFRAYMRAKYVPGYESPYWRVSIAGDAAGLPLRIARKASPAKSSNSRDPLRTGFSVVPQGKGRYAGFTLDGDGRFLLSDFTVTHNTSQLAIGRTLWRLGRDHNLRIAVVSSAQKNQAGKIVANLQTYIQKSRDLQAVFPGLRPGRLWAGNSFTVDRTVLSKDPTVQGTSIETGSLTGSRIDLMIIDDVLNHDNTRTADGRAKTIASLGSSTFIGRMTATSQILFLGNAFHPDDAMHAYAKNPSWHFAKFPVQLVDGTLTWPDRWPLSRIEKRRGEMHPDEVARQLFCIARDDSAGRFKRAWIHQCMDRGVGKRIAHSLNSLPPGYACFTGVDLGVRKKAGSDFTVLFTIVVHPNEDREIICCESGRWAGNEIVNRIIDTHRRYNSIIYVENNGAQQYILDFTKDQSAVPCRPLFTGKNKVHPDFGIEGLATEMSNAKWIIPSYGDHRAHPEIMLWADELVYYDPSSHSGDRLMASWIAREGARQWKKRPKIQQGTIQTQSR